VKVIVVGFFFCFFFFVFQYFQNNDTLKGVENDV
jgi:hypothetical protein